MDSYRVDCRKIKGTIRPVCSKSTAQRYLFCSYLAGETEHAVDRLEAFCADQSGRLPCRLPDDLRVALDCVGALEAACGPARLDCHDSATCLRLLMPIALAQGKSAEFIISEGLAARPMGPFVEELQEHGAQITELKQPGRGYFLDGKLKAGEYRLPGNISSQYFSGLLLALPLAEDDSRLLIEGELQSESYVDMTIAAMKLFGVEIERIDGGYIIKGNQQYRYSDKSDSLLEGDWSSAAMWLVAEEILGSGLKVEGLNSNSLQGDSCIKDIIQLYRSNGSEELTIDISDCPDLIGAISLLAIGKNRKTRIINAERLRYKECDRLSAAARILKQLGAEVEPGESCLLITPSADGGYGSDELIDTESDHRMVMLAGLASIVCRGPLIISGAEAVKKSYPAFFETVEELGGTITRYGI